MSEKRLRGYRAIGCARGEAPLGFSDTYEPIVKYDDHAHLVDREDLFFAPVRIPPPTKSWVVDPVGT